MKKKKKTTNPNINLMTVAATVANAPKSLNRRRCVAVRRRFVYAVRCAILAPRHKYRFFSSSPSASFVHVVLVCLFFILWPASFSFGLLLSACCVCAFFFYFYFSIFDVNQTDKTECTEPILIGVVRSQVKCFVQSIQHLNQAHNSKTKWRTRRLEIKLNQKLTLVLVDESEHVWSVSGYRANWTNFYTIKTE